MLTGIHFLLTYQCTYTCDHCFLYCSPETGGTFTMEQVRNVLDESRKIETVDAVFFEGGEPFLYHPLLVAGVREAAGIGYKTGIVTNCYWATTADDALLWLEPLVKAGLGSLSVSDDDFHSDDPETSPAKRVLDAAARLGMPADSICIDRPVVVDAQPGRGEPVVGGGAMLRGRAADKLTDGLPRRLAATMTSCPHEELVSPRRVHIDSAGNVHICQGISMGNMWRVPLSELVERYDHTSHPICGPLMEGGPAELARRYDMVPDEGYVEECHMCFEIRRKLLDRFPELLAPRQVYGMDAKD